jgi:hypothetical protein
MTDVLLREPQAVSLVLLLLLSLVLPYASTSFPSKKATKLAWEGQLIMAIQGLVILAWPGLAYLALVSAILTCGIFVYILSQASAFPGPTLSSKLRR